MKETSAAFGSDLAALLERARRACEEAQQLSSDYRFIMTWFRMQPRFSARSTPMLDGED
jgi:hypothetical protein